MNEVNITLEVREITNFKKIRAKIRANRAKIRIVTVIHQAN